MKAARLTQGACAANDRPMRDRNQKMRRGAWRTLALVAGCMAITGCINVNAPSEPIVIELNINIRQEVIYRLAADAGNTIEENADIF